MSIPEVEPEVAVLRWPADAAERARLASLGVPRLLVVDAGASPPATLSDLEDWVGGGDGPTDTVARTENLRRRAARRVHPVLDADGLLRYGGRWIDISPAQVPVIALLVQNFGSLVRLDEIKGAYQAGGGSGHLGSISTVIARMRRRVEHVGLELHSIRGRGLVLDAPSADG